MQIITTFLVILFVYFLPGLVMLWTLDFSSSRLIHQLFLALVSSLIFVPVGMITFGGIIPFVPEPAALLVWMGTALALGFESNRLGRHPVLALIQTCTWQAPRFHEHLLAAVCVLGFALLTNLPRLEMLPRGAAAVFVNPLDDHWRLAQLISATRTGAPLRYYLFPQIDQVDYYASCVLLAILGNIPLTCISLTRSMATHSILQTATFLGGAVLSSRFDYNEDIPGYSLVATHSGSSLYLRNDD